MADMTEEEAREWASALPYWDDDLIIGASKRCGITWTSHMGDWFVAHSPRNGNTHAEGTWEHWVTLAQLILNDPMTAIVRPEVFQSVPEPPDRYAETDRSLTYVELHERLSAEVDYE